MLILNDIMKWLGVDLEVARRVLDEMEMTGLDFSEASNATLKRAAKEAHRQVAA